MHTLQVIGVSRRKPEVKPTKDCRLEQAFIRSIFLGEQPEVGSFTDIGCRVVYSKQLKRIRLSRYLVSRLVFEPEKVNFQEVITLFDNQLWLEDKALKDPGFRQKFGKSLEDLSRILKETQRSEPISSYISRLSRKCKNQLEGFYFPQRNMGEHRRDLSDKFSVKRSKQPGILNQYLPPKAVIGVGYSDKGTRRDPAYDGSPHWTDVALFFARKET